MLEQFYRSVYPGGEAIDDYSNPIWIYEPTPGRPDGNIEILKHLSTIENREDAAFDFEKTLAKIEDYYLTHASTIPLLTAESGLRFAIKSVAYRYEERGIGVLF